MRTALSALALVAFLLVGACAGSNPSRKENTFHARKLLAHELIARQDWDAAFFYADQLHRERPDDAEVLVMRGIVYREQGLTEEAEADLQQALQRRSDLAEAHAALGLLLDSSGRHAEGERHHRKANDLVAENPVYLNNLGFSLFLGGKYAESVAVYRQATRLSPTNRRIRTNLGFAYAAAGDWPHAAHEFEKGSATPAQAKNNLGFAYERRGDVNTAYDLYLQAVRLDPHCEQARANLEAAAVKLGRKLPDDLPAADEGKKERTQP